MLTQRAADSAPAVLAPLVLLPLFIYGTGSASAQSTPQPVPPAAVVALPPVTPAAALATLLSDASRVNAQIPGRLRAYRARIESEMSLVVLDSGGRERTAQLEEIAS